MSTPLMSQTLGSLANRLPTPAYDRAHVTAGVEQSPTTDYAVNLGMACPKGWESLTPLTAKDRATTPMLRDSSGRLTCRALCS